MKTKVEVDGKILFVKKPGYKELSEAKLYSAKMFNQARLNGAMLKKQLWDHMKTNGMWTDEQQTQLETLINFINDTTAELNKGKNGKFKKLSEVRQAAIDIRVARIKERLLLSEYTDLESLTIEGISDQAHFDALILHCVFNEDGTRTFSSLEDYFENAGKPWARACAEELSYFLYPNLSRDWEKNLPENKVLIKYNLVDKDLRLVNKDGQLVDRDYKVVDENGNYIDADKNVIDSDGNKLDNEGNIITETVFEEFDDDLQQNIVV